MADVTNCRRCGRLFNYISGQKVCPNCREEIEKKFEEVKAFINEHRTATMNEICEACDVDSGQIQTWVRQERLQFASDSPIKVSCEKCGALIQSGRFCDKCRNSMANSLNSMMHKPVPELKKEPPKDNKNRMRFLNN